MCGDLCNSSGNVVLDKLLAYGCANGLCCLLFCCVNHGLTRVLDAGDQKGVASAFDSAENDALGVFHTLLSGQRLVAAYGFQQGGAPSNAATLMAPDLIAFLYCM